MKRSVLLLFKTQKFYFTSFFQYLSLSRTLVLCLLSRVLKELRNTHRTTQKQPSYPDFDGGATVIDSKKLPNDLHPPPFSLLFLNISFVSLNPTQLLKIPQTESSINYLDSLHTPLDSFKTSTKPHSSSNLVFHIGFSEMSLLALGFESDSRL